MQLGMVGLGKMGANMVERLAKGGQQVVAFDLSEAAVSRAKGHGAKGASSIADLIGQLSAPRVVWVMVPSGNATESTIQQLVQHLAPGDVIIDGGNSNYKDSQRRSKELSAKGLQFVDVGTSGGVWGLTEGYSMMIGGEVATVERLRPILSTLAPGKDTGWGRVGPAGAGHFVKMVHNGIEYGMMQAFAEGFNIMDAKTELQLDLLQISEIWRHGSVVRSWLLDLLAQGLGENRHLEGIGPRVSDSGEGRWTVAEAIDLDIPAPVITLSLLERLRSRQENSMTYRLLSLMRNKFGGHSVIPPKPT
jgi:6-phosphogluconate dehydrogenase